MAKTIPSNNHISLKPNQAGRIFVCPSDSTNAYADISFCNTAPEISDTALATVFVTTKSDHRKLTEEDVLFPNVEIAGSNLFPVLSKVIMGAGESMFIRIEDKKNVNSWVNMRGQFLLENNVNVIKAGMLGTITVDGPEEGAKLLYVHEHPLSAYAEGTVMVGNHTEEHQTVFLSIIKEERELTEKDFCHIFNLEPGGVGFSQGFRLTKGERFKIIAATGKITARFNGMMISET